MKFRELVSPTLTDLFVKEIKEMILSKELQINQRLPSEREMANSMKVSLAVVNSGIVRLQSQGFLRVVPRKGIYVNNYIRDGNLQTLEAILEYNQDYFQKDLLDAMVDFRGVVELRCKEMACLNRTEENIQAIEQTIEEFTKSKDAASAGEYTFRFNQEIAIASGNQVYPLIIALFKWVYISTYHTLDAIEGADPALAYMHQILECIKEQNITAVRKLSQESLNHCRALFHAYYQEGQKIHSI